MKHSLNAEKRKKGPLLWAVFITILMLGSTIGYVFSGFQDNTQEKADHIYKTYSFTKTESGWVFFKDNKQVYVDYLPEEVESIDFTTIPFDKGKVYAAFKSTEKDSSLDYSLGKVYTFLKERDYNPFFACILEEGCPDIPIVDCQESSFPIVLFIELR